MHPHAAGIIHTYQGYDPLNLPGPNAEPPDVVSGAFEHLLTYGSTRQLTPEELARAVRIDPREIKGLGPSLEALIAMLEERKRKILARYESDSVRATASSEFADRAAAATPPPSIRKRFDRAVRDQQLRDLEQLWYSLGDEQSPFAGPLMRLVQALADKYQVEQLAAKHTFTGREALSVSEAIAVKEELERIDQLLEQLRQAAENAQVAIIDLEALSEFAEPGDLEGLRSLQQQVEAYLQAAAERQGIEQTADGYRLTPQAWRLFQSKLLTTIFAELDASRSGRHQGPIEGDGAVELQRTKPFEFGDSVANMDVVQSMMNAMARRAGEASSARGARGEFSFASRDIEIHRTRNSPKCATSVILDMSGSMRHGGQYIHCKRMALALDGLIRREYPGDFLQFIEMYSLAKPRAIAEIPALMPKAVTIHNPVVRLRADMSDPAIGEYDVPLHFTNIQRSLQIARQFLGAQDTPNRQVVLITDGLPTAHFENEVLYLLYPPHPRTEEATMREAMRCRQEGITINIILLPSWSQSSEDVQFAQRMAESTGGRVFFSGGRDLDRFVIWDYVSRRRTVVG